VSGSSSPPPGSPSPTPSGHLPPVVGSPLPEVPTATRPRPRRWPLVLGAILGLAGAGIGLQQRQVAAEWSERAAAVEEQRDEARGRAEAFQRQLDEAVESLAVSESDVVALEGRVRELADEKAQAEDVATTTGVERDTLVQLSNAIAGSVTDLDRCVGQLFDLLGDAIDAFNRQGAGEVVDVGPLNADRTATTATCNQARQDAADASATAERLLR
jgi:hypothetical protein